MYLSELLAALARRWWLVTLGVLATIGLCYAAFTFVPSEHEIHATMLVLPPSTTTEVVHNPLLALGDLPPAADVLARAMNSGDISDDLLPPGSTGEYTVTRDTSTSGPVLAVMATDRSAQQAEDLLDAVLTRMPQEFAALQTTIDVPTSSTMGLTELARDTRSTESTKSQVRAVLLAAVGGLTLTVFAASLLDGLLRRRRAAHQQARRGRGAKSGLVPPPQEEAAEHSASVSIGDSHHEFSEPSSDDVVAPRLRDVVPRQGDDAEWLEGTRPT